MIIEKKDNIMSAFNNCSTTVQQLFNTALISQTMAMSPLIMIAPVVEVTDIAETKHTLVYNHTGVVAWLISPTGYRTLLQPHQWLQVDDCKHWFISGVNCWYVGVTGDVFFIPDPVKTFEFSVLLGFSIVPPTPQDPEETYRAGFPTGVIYPPENNPPEDCLQIGTIDEDDENRWIRGHPDDDYPESEYPTEDYTPYGPTTPRATTSIWSDTAAAQ